MLASAGEIVGIVVAVVVVGGGGVVWFASRCLKIVQQGSVGVVKRLGQYLATNPRFSPATDAADRLAE